MVPFATEEKVEETLYQMMAGACKVLRENGCSLVSGHSCEGKELSLGFAVTGTVDDGDDDEGDGSGGGGGGYRGGSMKSSTKSIGHQQIWLATKMTPNAGKLGAVRRQEGAIN